MAVSELSWIRPDPPEECRQFFANEYPAMVDIDTNLTTIKNCGYELVEHFILPESAWWAPYYNPLGERLRLMWNKYAPDSERLAMIDSFFAEIEQYRKHSDYYGNVFFLMQK
ncbi:MAG TPA: hypothetical protein ENN67_03235 [Firmicutes bacterium]|nr:hypothetical protein [Bacillota bacterium]